MFDRILARVVTHRLFIPALTLALIALPYAEAFAGSRHG